MGLTTRRIGFVLLSALAILLSVRKPSVRSRETASRSLDQREREVTVALANARLHWSAIEQRDEVLASTEPSLITMSGFPAGAGLAGKDSAYLLDIVERARRDSTILVRIHLYDPASYAKNWWGAYSGALIARGDRTTCTAIVPVDRLPSGKVEIGRNGLLPLLSPCLLLATFGTPGRTVGNWLDVIRYAPARSGKWLVQSAMEVWDSDPWAWLRDFSLGDPAGSPGFALSRLLGLEREAQLLAPPYYFGQIGVQCLSGMKRSCARAVMDSGIISRETGRLPRDLTVAPSLLRSSNISSLTPRPPGATFLSDLIRDKGQEKFRIFWKSELPFEIAFENAFQEPLEDWTLRWAREKWLASYDSRYRSEEILLGVTLRVSWIPLSIGWALLALGSTAWAARRRQITAS